MSATDVVRALAQPIIEQNHAELYDIEYESGVLRISVDREGGIDVDTIGELSRLISDALDREDPIPDSKYMLEVTSPGVERKLRTATHFQKQIGNLVSIKLRAPVDNVRRFEGTVESATEAEVEVLRSGQPEGTLPMKIAYSDIESARSVYDWDAEQGDTRRSSKSQSASKSGNQSSEPSKKKAVS